MVAPKREMVTEKKPEKINIGELLHSMDYARWDHPTVMKGFRVMKEMQRWLESRYAPELMPYVSIDICAHGVILMMDDLLLWSSTEDGDENLTLEFCQEMLRNQADFLKSPFED